MGQLQGAAELDKMPRDGLDVMGRSWKFIGFGEGLRWEYGREFPSPWENLCTKYHGESYSIYAPVSSNVAQI
jgi:hypothetical protein